MDDLEHLYESHMAPFAARSGSSRGRLHADHDTPYRGYFQRDRDRIVHSAAFRRLQYKTQVFMSVMEGDYFRNRLTHTLEVTQIARTLSRALRTNEDLAEALALAHDLGHGPFGHSGESALNDVMRDKGGFDHNAQGLRVVDTLERRYVRFCGLNLSYETREGYVKNYVPDGHRGHPRSNLGFAADEMPSLEVQIVGHADEIAYDTHDLDDGLVSGYLTDEDVRSVSLWREVEESVVQEHAELKTDARLRRYAVVRRLIATLVGDLLAETRRRLDAKRINSAEDVRHCGEELAGFSAEMAPRKLELETLLMDRFYRCERIKKHTDMWRERLKQLFAAYHSNPKLLPEDHQNRVCREGETIERVICDYVASMTDRFASKQWELLVK